MRHNIENGINKEYIHIPVLWREIVSFVENSKLSGKGIFVDCTLGEGGHSEIILKHFENINVMAFERDPDILKVSMERLSKFGNRVSFFNDNFSNIKNHIDPEIEINYLLYDFGISSFHYEKSSRGFAFSKNEKLDMRLDNKSDIDAGHIVNKFKEKELADLIYKYGEERWSRRIAAKICEKRKEKLIETTEELAQIVLFAIPKRFHVKNIHPATRVFQALRIYVNNELESITNGLKNSFGFLAEMGRIMAISFHSLEDRIVKDWFKRMSRGCLCDLEPKDCMCQNEKFVKILTKKPLIAEQDEVEVNNRARSAKLRVCEKL